MKHCASGIHRGQQTSPAKVSLSGYFVGKPCLFSRAIHARSLDKVERQWELEPVDCSASPWISGYRIVWGQRTLIRSVGPLVTFVLQRR